MANALFLTPAAVAVGGGASAASAQSGTPAANLLDNIPAKLWRGSSTSGQYVRLDMGSGGAVVGRAAALINTNLSASGTMTVRASNTSLTAAASATPLYSGAAFVGTAPPSTRKNRIAFCTFANSTAFRYWHIDLADSAPVATYFEAGRLMIGTIFQPTLNLSNIGREFFSADPQDPSPYNQTFTERRGNVGRIMTPAWAAADQDDVEDNFEKLVLACGNGGDFLFSIDPAHATRFAQWSMQCVFSGNPKVSDVPYFNNGKQMWTLGATLKELV